MGRTRNLLLAWVVFLWPSQVQNQEPPRIRVSVNRVNAGVNVTDKDGNFVEGLHIEDFRVFDNDVEQPITDFLSVEEPAQILLLVESGPAVIFLSNNHLLAADQLLASLGPHDRVAIAAYTRTPEVVLNFTENKMEARAALHAISFNIGFGDLNLSQSVSTALNWLAVIPGKKTIVLLSTGVDTSAPGDINAVEGKLLASDVRVFAVSVSADFRKPAKGKKIPSREKATRAQILGGFERADGNLRQLAALTGGAAYFPDNAREFPRVYTELAKLLRHEYSLAFAPSAADGQRHSIRVECRVPGYKASHRQAYLAPTPSQ